MLNVAHLVLVESHGLDPVDAHFAALVATPAPPDVSPINLPSAFARWGESTQAEAGQDAMLRLLGG